MARLAVESANLIRCRASSATDSQIANRPGKALGLDQSVDLMKRFRGMT